MKKLTKTIAIFVLIVMIASLNSGCRKKMTQKTPSQKIELVYYRLFDNEEIFTPIIQEFENKYPHIQIKYRKFTDPDKYEELIINELAEGEGPDMFSIKNTGITKHRKKLTPIPLALITPQAFRETFVKVTHDDLLRYDEEGQERIYALPLYVDTLGLYYNKEHFENQIPSRGKPAQTWDELKEDVFKLSKKDNSFERFETSGIAMGRADNILRAVDILYLLFLQYKTEFYDDDFTRAIFGGKQGLSAIGIANTPSVEALELFTSFGLPSNKHYSWNNVIAEAASADKEIRTFARGKTSMIFGYSYLYEDIMATIRDVDKKGEATIKESAVKIALVPQVFDPSKTNDLDVYASYFTETVARTSKHPNEAWAFLKFLVSKENMQYYHEKTKRPSSRRDLLEMQVNDPIYGVFAKQAGYAESLIMYDENKYKNIFEETIQSVIETKKPKDAIIKAEKEINNLLPQKQFILLPKEQTENK